MIKAGKFIAKAKEHWPSQTWHTDLVYITI